LKDSIKTMSCMVCNKANYMIPSLEVVSNDTE